MVFMAIEGVDNPEVKVVLLYLSGLKQALDGSPLDSERNDMTTGN